MRSLLVVGGTGFVGSHLCKQAIQDGWKVSSLSRRGTPDSCKDPKRSAWMSKINWIKGDVMHPETYTAQLSGVDTVVHSMGVILENPYYQDIALHPINTACTFYKNGSLPEKPFRTYAEANRDSAIILAETCMKFENIKNFVYMSANHAVPPFLPGGYIKAKIETENSLAVLPLHTLIIRPSLMYSQERPLSGIAASVMGLLGSVPILPTLMPWATLKPLAVEDVAKAILAAIKKSEIVYSVSGKQEVFEIGDLEILAKEPVVQAS